MHSAVRFFVIAVAATALSQPANAAFVCAPSFEAQVAEFADGVALVLGVVVVAAVIATTLWAITRFGTRILRVLSGAHATTQRSIWLVIALLAGSVGYYQAITRVTCVAGEKPEPLQTLDLLFEHWVRGPISDVLYSTIVGLSGVEWGAFALNVTSNIVATLLCMALLAVLQRFWRGRASSGVSST